MTNESQGRNSANGLMNYSSPSPSTCALIQSEAAASGGPERLHKMRDGALTQRMQRCSRRRHRLPVTAGCRVETLLLPLSSPVVGRSHVFSTRTTELFSYEVKNGSCLLEWKSRIKSPITCKCPSHHVCSFCWRHPVLTTGTL